MTAPQQKGHLLFDEEELESSLPDPQLQSKINQYLEQRTSKKELVKPAAGAQAPRRGAAGQGQGQGQDEGHTGITDDEAGPGGDDDEGEPDYDVASRMTLKASSEAFLEVMAEAARMRKEELEAEKANKTVGAKKR